MSLTPTAYGTSPKFDTRISVGIEGSMPNLGEAGRGPRELYEELCC